MLVNVDRVALSSGGGRGWHLLPEGEWEWGEGWWWSGNLLLLTFVSSIEKLPWDFLSHFQALDRMY